MSRPAVSPAHLEMGALVAPSGTPHLVSSLSGMSKLLFSMEAKFETWFTGIVGPPFSYWAVYLTGLNFVVWSFNPIIRRLPDSTCQETFWPCCGCFPSALGVLAIYYGPLPLLLLCAAAVIWPASPPTIFK